MVPAPATAAAHPVVQVLLPPGVGRGAAAGTATHAVGVLAVEPAAAAPLVWAATPPPGLNKIIIITILNHFLKTNASLATYCAIR